MPNVRFCTLFSGSSANCTYIGCENSAVLVDAGAGIKRLGASLCSIGSCYEKIGAIFITHEHTDHIAGLPTILRKYRIPVIANEKTLDSILYAYPDIDDSLFRVMPTGARAERGAFRVKSFASSHDSAQSVGYVIEAGGLKLGVLTDTGEVSEAMINEMSGCKALVLESNHDSEMLRTGPYPYMLKQRIAGKNGHLSNEQCANVICRLSDTVEDVLLAHLSKENNTPRLAQDTVKNILSAHGIDNIRISAALPADVSRIIEFGGEKCLQ